MKKSFIQINTKESIYLIVWFNWQKMDLNKSKNRERDKDQFSRFQSHHRRNKMKTIWFIYNNIHKTFILLKKNSISI